jgi:CheY-like chemotaxis protein
VLVVDNDAGFTRFLMDLARAHHFKVLATSHGSIALSLAKQFLPTAIILDIKLPDIDGWKVLGHLKHEAVTRHIPVHIVSNADNCDVGTRRGATSTLSKPINRDSLDKLLVQIAEAASRETRTLVMLKSMELGLTDRVGDLIGTGFVETKVASNSRELTAMCESTTPDVLVLPAETKALKTLSKLLRSPNRPRSVLLQTNGDLNAAIRSEISTLATTVPIRLSRDIPGLLEGITIALQLPHQELSIAGRTLIEEAKLKLAILSGKKVLVVDDDIRNVFAMTSLLERQNMEVLSAENGQEAIDILSSNDDIDVVLMDIMIPGMDGYETIRAIRKDGRFMSLPIIAVTAKAMKGDREKCLQAGASDYISKPVDSEKLMSLLHAWLYPVHDEDLDQSVTATEEVANA